MMRFHSVIVGGIALAAVMTLAGCRNDNVNNTNATNRADGVASNTATAPQQRETTQPKPAQATPVAPASGAVDSLPIADAAAFRDRLLELARSVKFDSQASASTNATAIRAAWERQYPSLKFSIFYSMPADASTVSSSDTFLISGADEAGRFDQLYAFAVVDTKGKCAGGAAVIPGDDTKRKVSDEKAPTVFKPIDMSSAKSCTGEAASDNYRP
jgi:hypothetical protein